MATWLATHRGRLPLLALCISILQCADAQSAQEPVQYSLSGCLCIGPCQRTADQFLTAWCLTSQENPPQGGTVCGRYSLSRQAYWDDCISNTTSDGTLRYLDNFNDMWWHIAVTTTGVTGGSFLLCGIVASVLTSPRRTLFWLPAAATGLGVLYGFTGGAVFAVIIAFYYLVLPYAIDVSVAISLGFAFGLMLVYSSLGRQYKAYTAPHASEFGDG
jgi:hypothetical protein